MSDKVVSTEVTVKYTMEDGFVQTIKFNLSDVEISQSRDMNAIYDENGKIVEYEEIPGKEGSANVVIKGVIKKRYDN